MNLFNRKILNQRIANYSFPTGEKAEKIQKLIDGWQKALKDSNLSKTKEKSLQSKFLTIFFEEVLGYTDQTAGNDTWTVIAEPKTEVDSQVADGSLGFFTKDKKETKAVIELKDAKTSLDKKQKGRDKGYTPVEQGYLYATKFDRCKWVIISNFREIRLYSKDRSQDFVEKFEILELHKEEIFKRFYYLLNSENLLFKDGISPIEDLRKKSLDQEEDISKKFYTEYKQVRLNLYEHLTKHNKEVNRITLFKKSQKILDRIVFILFCEDTANLLPKEILLETYKLGIRSRARSDEKVWPEIKNLFMDIDEGRSDIEPAINGYNGGLFKSDEVLDNLVIKDDAWQEVVKLSEYDFESDLNVNILGHIFEQSISDIENIKAEIEGTSEDKTKSKRKKDGIFYTPEYITKYIVENTVGKYLEEHPDKLDSIKILDPACGSGAFLNQAHSFLMNEYKVRYEEKLLAKEKKGEAITLFDYNPAENNRSILLNNLYGVDLNDESVEISKLSLWLKTARKDEPLQSLDNNLKVGNSLIDDPEVAGDKAFDWDKEFKDIMKDGGFDVIVGNPPYVRQELIKEIKPYLKNHYDVYTGIADLYVYFFERALKMVKDGGYFAFIVSDKFTRANYGKPLRKWLTENYTIVEYVKSFGDQVFEGVTVDPCIIIIKKEKPTTKSELIVSNYIGINQVKSFKMPQSALTTKPWNFVSKKVLDLKAKIESKGTKIKDIEGIHINYGIKTGFNEAFIISKAKRDELVKADPKSVEIIKPLLRGRDIKRYSYEFANLYLINAHNGYVSNTGLKINPINVKKDYPAIWNYLVQLNNDTDGKLEKRTDQGTHWSNLRNCAYLEEFEKPKIIYPEFGYRFAGYFDKSGYYLLDTSHFIIASQFELAILNSSLSKWYMHLILPSLGSKGMRFKPTFVQQIPLVMPSDKGKEQLKSSVNDLIISLKNLKEAQKALVDLLNSEYTFTSKKDLIDLGWNEFIEQFEKQKIKLSLDQKEDLQKWFKKKQKELSDLQSKIDKLDREIDQEVYKLYGLTKEEIDIIEEVI